MKTAKQVCKEIDSLFFNEIIGKVQSNGGSYSFYSKIVVPGIHYWSGSYESLISELRYFPQLSKGETLDQLRKLGFKIEVTQSSMFYSSVESTEELKPILIRIFSKNKLQCVFKKVPKTEMVTRIEISACCGKKRK